MTTDRRSWDRGDVRRYGTTTVALLEWRRISLVAYPIIVEGSLRQDADMEVPKPGIHQLSQGVLNNQGVGFQ